MAIQVKARLMFPSKGSSSHGPPLLGRLWGTSPFPGVVARMRPSDSPAASATALVPLAGGLPWRERFSRSPARAFADERRAGGLGFGSSAAPIRTKDRSGSPGLPGRPLAPRHGHPPRRVRRPLARLAVTPTAAFREAKPLG